MTFKLKDKISYMSKIKKLLESLNSEPVEVSQEQVVNEADTVRFEELEPEAQEFIQRREFDKLPPHMFSIKNCTFWDGIHGSIMDVNSPSHLKYTKEDLKKLIADKQFRWIEVKSLGF